MNGMIKSDEYYVWDNWGFVSADGILHIYAQYCEKSVCLRQEDRYWNVHIEHFISCDQGETFCKCGPVIQKSADAEAFDSYNIWSGCAFPLKSGEVLGLYTGLQLPKEHMPGHRNFALQSIGLAVSTDDGFTFTKMPEPLISPIRDYEILKEKGYYLGPKETLGIIDDPDGTFMCLRDPEIFQEGDVLHILFGAKAAIKTNDKIEIRNAVGHAILKNYENVECIEIQKPLFIANENDYNQLELPNIIKWNDTYFLIISASKLDYIGQPDCEVDKTTRIYKSSKLIGGDWQPYGEEGKHIILSSKADKLYGPKLIHQKEHGGVFHFRPFVVGETYAPATIGIDLRGVVPKVIYHDCLINEQGGGA